MASQGAKKSFLQVLKNDSQQPYKLLIVGETGSGKTSFLNLLYNCNRVQQLGCKFDEEGMKHFQQFNDGSLEKDESQKMASKTSGTRLYNVELGAMKVGIIDTPGFGDSRGLETDKKNVKTIMDVLHKEDYINCVCLIINGRTPRVTVTLRYVLTEITAIMPKKILNNVVVVFSNSKEALYVNFDPDELTDYFGQEPRHTFYIDNPYAIYQKVKEQKKDLRKVAKDLERAFEHAAGVLQELCEAIYEFTPVHTKDFTDLYDKKQAIESSVLVLLTKHDNQVRLEKALNVAKEKLDAAKTTKDLNAAFEEKQTFSKWIVKKTDRHNTLCGYADCHVNCHPRCNLPKLFEKNKFKNCWCMNGGETCRKCGHNFIYHYHDEALFEEQPVVHKMVDEKMKERFEKAKSDEEKQQMVYDKIAHELNESEQERKRLAEALFTKIAEFQELGVLRNYVKLVENQLAVIETRIEGTTGPETDHLRKTKEELEKKLLELKPVRV